MGKKIIDGQEGYEDANEDPNNCVSVGADEDTINRHYDSLMYCFSPCPFCGEATIPTEVGDDGKEHIASREWTGRPISEFKSGSAPVQRAGRSNSKNGPEQQRSQTTGMTSSSGGISSAASGRRSDPKANINPEHAKPNRRVSAAGALMGGYVERKARQLIQNSSGKSVEQVLGTNNSRPTKRPQLLDLSDVDGKWLEENPSFQQAQDKFLAARRHWEELRKSGASAGRIRAAQMNMSYMRENLNAEEARRSLHLEQNRDRAKQYTPSSNTNISGSEFHRNVSAGSARQAPEWEVEVSHVEEPYSSEYSGIENEIERDDFELARLQDDIRDAQELISSYAGEPGNEDRVAEATSALHGLNYDLREQVMRKKSNVKRLGEIVNRNKRR